MKNCSWLFYQIKKKGFDLTMKIDALKYCLLVTKAIRMAYVIVTDSKDDSSQPEVRLSPNLSLVLRTKITQRKLNINQENTSLLGGLNHVLTRSKQILNDLTYIYSKF